MTPARWGVAALWVVALGLVVALVIVLTRDDDGTRTASVATTTTAVVATTPSPSAPAAAEFNRHLGLALSALRTGVQEPYKNGDFTKLGVGLIATYSKAADSLSYAIKQLNQAREAATGPGGAGALSDQVNTLLADAGKLIDGAQSGTIDQAALTDLMTTLDQLGTTAKAAGIDVPQTVPGVN
jgi:hypothetical protein